MKKIIFVICLLLIIIGFGGCKMDDSLQFEIKYYVSEHRMICPNAFYHVDKTYTDTGVCLTTSKLIKSYEELTKLCDEYNSPAFSENSDKYNSEVNQLIRSFDSDYFNSKALVICFGTGFGGGLMDKINFISKKNDELIINYTREECEQADVIMNDPWILIIEVQQKDVKEINNIQLIYNKL